MNDFWKGVPAMRADYGQQYTAFPLFGVTHCMELLAAAVIVTGCVLVYRRCTPAVRRKILRGIALGMLADEIIKHLAMAATGQWSFLYLPLHLCSIHIFVCAYDAWQDSPRAKELLYTLCIPGAAIALLSPSWQTLPVWNIMHLHSLSIHILLLLYPILLLAGGFRPAPSRLPQVIEILAAEAAPIYCFNRVMGTNFFFLNDPYGNPIVAIFTGILGERYYILGLPAGIIFVAVMMYLPWHQCADQSQPTVTR